MLLKTLVNQAFKMQYYFIQSKSNKFFLLSIKNAENFHIWHFTSSKKWEPTHNSGAYDGFEKAEQLISSAIYEDKYITLGSIIDGKKGKYIDELADKRFEVLYYFWVHKKNAFLIRPKSTTTISLWHLTAEKKWMPLHNAGAYDGFEKADTATLDINFDFKEATLTVGLESPFTDICIDTGFCQ